MTFSRAVEMTSARQFRSVVCEILTGTFFHRLLNNNQIKSIPGGSFEDLENLKYL